MFATLSNRPQILHTSFKKNHCFSLLGQQFFNFNKSNDLLLLLLRLAMMATSHIEIPQEKLKQDGTFYCL
jgi:hypothetical protein